jgi:predicted nucleic acid-binding Zn ribbon protein
MVAAAVTAPTLFDGRHCAICAAPLPRGSRRHRLTCSHACRQEMYRATRPEITLWNARESVTENGPSAPESTSDLETRPERPQPSLAAIAAGIPTPVDPIYGPARAYMSLVDHGGIGKATWRAAFGTDGGRGTVPVGPAMARRHAQRLVEILNARLGA